MAPIHSKLPLALAVALVVFSLDQFTKYLALRSLLPGESVEVLGSWLRLTLVRNSGAAFSLGTGFTVLLSMLAIVIVVVVVKFAARIGSAWWAVALGGLLGGALGNLWDRIFRPPGPLRGQVVDFIELPHWPVFNVADMAIVGAACIMAVLVFRGVPLTGVRDGSRGTGE